MAKPIIVVGAGICGISTAIWLQRSNLEVILVDKSDPGMGASYGNAGLLAQWAIVPVNEPSILKQIPRYLIDPMSPLFLKWRYLPWLTPWLIKFLRNANSSDSQRTIEALIPLLSDSVQQHKRLTEGTSAANWIADSKFSYAYRSLADFQKDSFSWECKKKAGMVPEIFTGKQVQEIEPICGSVIDCLAVLSGQGHIINPQGYITELMKIFYHNGGKFINAKVKDFGFHNEKIHVVFTDNGKFECDKVVITAGIWSKNLMRKLGLKIPLEAERGYHVVYKNASILPRNPMMMTVGKFGVTPMKGDLRCAGTVELGGIKIGPSQRPIKLLRRRVAEAFPKMTYDKTEEWLGFRPTAPDSLPLIGQLKESGVYTAFGHQHIGMTSGPKTGRLISDIINYRSPNINMSFYDPNRFNS